MKNIQAVSPNLWIVVKNTQHKRDPRVAQIDYVAVVEEKGTERFNALLVKTGQYAYRARSYGDYFPGWESQRRQYF